MVFAWIWTFHLQSIFFLNIIIFLFALFPFEDVNCFVWNARIFFPFYLYLFPFVCLFLINSDILGGKKDLHLCKGLGDNANILFMEAICTFWSPSAGFTKQGKIVCNRCNLQNSKTCVNSISTGFLYGDFVGESCLCVSVWSVSHILSNCIQLDLCWSTTKNSHMSEQETGY